MIKEVWGNSFKTIGIALKQVHDPFPLLQPSQKKDRKIFFFGLQREGGNQVVRNGDYAMGDDAAGNPG